jgi:hypothetical protein
MAEPTSEPKTQLALDMGWRTATVFALFFCFCFLAAGISLWGIFTAAPVNLKISWQTFFALLMASWGAWKFEQRVVRFGVGLLVLSSSSKVLLAGFHAPIDAQIFNAEIMRAVNVLLLIGLCVWIVVWFKPRIKRV